MKTPQKLLIPIILASAAVLAIGGLAIYLFRDTSSKSKDSPELTDSSDTESDSDSCLQGDWVMDRVSLDLLVSSAVPVQGITIPSGEISMQFSGNNYIYSGNYTIRISPTESTYLEAIARHSNSGTFSTGNGAVVFTSEVSESEAMVWNAYQDGKKVSAAGSGPEYDYPQAGGGPYRCSSTRLEIDTQGAGGQTLTMFFTKKS